MLRWMTVVLFALLPGLVLAVGPDADGDGIDDTQEDVLGTNLQSPERLQTILDEGLESAGLSLDTAK